MREKDFEDILCKYPQLIEEGLRVEGRQVTCYGRRMDILFNDRFGRKLIVEIKMGPIKDLHIGQIMSYEGMLLSADDPTIRIMLVGNRVPPNIQRSLDHHGIAWKEISMSQLQEFIKNKKDIEFDSLFEEDYLKPLRHHPANIATSREPIFYETGNSYAAYTKLLASMRIGHALGEHQKAGTYIEYPGNGFNRICLYEYENAPQNTFSLAIHSGDTCKQARELFQHFTYAKALALEKQGWNVRSHFHLAWQNKNILFTKGDKAINLSEYIDYWRLNQGNIRKYNKEEFGLLQKLMREAKVMDDYDIAAFDEFFRTHKYQSVITCPGIANWISYSKEKLNEETEILSAELREKTESLIKIYNQNIAPTII